MKVNVPPFRESHVGSHGRPPCAARCVSGIPVSPMTERHCRTHLLKKGSITRRWSYNGRRARALGGGKGLVVQWTGECSTEALVPSCPTVAGLQTGTETSLERRADREHEPRASGSGNMSPGTIRSWWTERLRVQLPVRLEIVWRPEEYIMYKILYCTVQYINSNQYFGTKSNAGNQNELALLSVMSNTSHE